jgi:hypothetical protein
MFIFIICAVWRERLRDSSQALTARWCSTQPCAVRPSARGALQNIIHYAVQAGAKITADTWFEFRLVWRRSDRYFVIIFSLCRQMLRWTPAEIKCINLRRITTVFSNCWRKQLHVSALFWIFHHQVETGISEKIRILQCGHQEWGNEISFFAPSQTLKGPKHVVVFFKNFKIQLCYDGHLYTWFLPVLNHTTGIMPPKVVMNEWMNE